MDQQAKVDCMGMCAFRNVSFVFDVNHPPADEFIVSCCFILVLLIPPHHHRPSCNPFVFVPVVLLLVVLSSVDMKVL